MEAMMNEYGREKGKRVFYASENKGTIKGVAKSAGRGTRARLNTAAEKMMFKRSR